MSLAFRTSPASRTLGGVTATALTLLGNQLNQRTGRYGYNSLIKSKARTLQRQLVRAAVEDAVFDFPALDSYYANMFLMGSYEIELYKVLHDLRDADYFFVDAGANLGYWSVLVTSGVLGPHPAVAIEASGSTYELLRHNSALNFGRFVPLHAALSDESGKILRFDEAAPHASRSVIGEGSSSASEASVVSVTVDDVVDEFVESSCPIVVKLDVEGAELGALRGSARTFATHDVLMLAEDHGADPTHKVSAAFLQLGLTLWFLSDTDLPSRITRVTDLDRLKTDPHKGYNVAAHRSDSKLAARAGIFSA